MTLVFSDQLDVVMMYPHRAQNEVPISCERTHAQKRRPTQTDRRGWKLPRTRTVKTWLGVFNSKRKSNSDSSIWKVAKGKNFMAMHWSQRDEFPQQRNVKYLMYVKSIAIKNEGSLWADITANIICALCRCFDTTKSGLIYLPLTENILIFQKKTYFFVLKES